MKKLIAVLLAAVLCLAFAACGGDKTTDKTVDSAAMFKALLADVTYPDNATELDSSMASVLIVVFMFFLLIIQMLSAAFLFW